MWKPGDIVVWREIYKNYIWHAHPAIIVKDTPGEMALAFLPGSEGMGPEGWVDGKNKGDRRWEFIDDFWNLKKYLWHTYRALYILEPKTYYAMSCFWNNENDQFRSYYINFQLPFKRSHCGIDTLDLDLDIIINPDLSWEWKDEKDYQMAVEHRVILPEWIQGIEVAKKEIFERLAARQYPLDGSWLNWKPDPNWSPPKLPENWDKI